VLLALTLTIADDKDDLSSVASLNALEAIDDDCDREGVSVVKVDDKEFAAGHGVMSFPALVYFEHGVPNVYPGQAGDAEEVLSWVRTQLRSDEMEEVTDEMLKTLVDEHEHVAVIVCKYRMSASQAS